MVHAQTKLGKAFLNYRAFYWKKSSQSNFRHPYPLWVCSWGYFLRQSFIIFINNMFLRLSRADKTVFRHPDSQTVKVVSEIWFSESAHQKIWLTRHFWMWCALMPQKKVSVAGFWWRRAAAQIHAKCQRITYIYIYTSTVTR